MREDEILGRFFRFASGKRVLLGPGDDAAVLDVHGLGRIAMSSDSLVEGIHFLPDADARLLGRKSLSVALSDMAAMGAEPLFATVALIHPGPAERWLAGFSAGLAEVADEHGMSIVGGDLAAGGQLAVNVSVCGDCPECAPLRSGACAGDDLWLTGCAGGAALGLALLRGEAELADASAAADAIARHLNPSARIKFGRRVAGVAGAAIDTSDGLWKSLKLMGAASGAAIEVEADSIPLPAGMAQAFAAPLSRAIGASDDYELLFAAAPDKGGLIEDVAQAAQVAATRIGRVARGGGVSLVRDGKDVTAELAPEGHEHWG